MSNIIQTHELSKRFRRTDALRGLNFEVPQGSILALVGPNGAGKTTAIKLLMNIHRASAGSAEVLGVDSRTLGPAQFAQIGYVSENQEMPEWMSVGYFLDYWKPFYPTWDRDLERELVRQLELPLDRKINQLSRGMKMKAALASSLAYRPKLIVLDEPFSGLDALVRDELIEGILDRAAESTILISSHDLAEIESFATHVAFLEEGRLRFSEAMDSLTGRFREITLTFDHEASVPSNLPQAWLDVEASGSVLRLVDSLYEEATTAAAIRTNFGDVRDIRIATVPLRSIFVTLARADRVARRSAKQ